LIANSVSADYFVEAWSGLGVVRNYGDKNITSVDPFPKIYPRTIASDTKTSWDFDWKPDAVVINLGTNDYSTNPQPPRDIFETGYYNFINYIRSKYPQNLRLFLVCGPIIGNPCCEYIQEVAGNIGATYINMQNILTYPNDYGCDGHPNIYGHKKMYDVAFPVIQKVMQWF